MARGFRDLQVYQLAYELAMDIFRTSKRSPPEEKYSLTDQIRRSSRSVAANIAEGYRKRQYEKVFVLKLADADGECTETQVWPEFARIVNIWNEPPTIASAAATNVSARCSAG